MTHVGNVIDAVLRDLHRYGWRCICGYRVMFIEADFIKATWWLPPLQGETPQVEAVVGGSAGHQCVQRHQCVQMLGGPDCWWAKMAGDVNRSASLKVLNEYDKEGNN